MGDDEVATDEGLRGRVRRLEKLLCRKERLLREAQHRIKNNLQLVQSCIRLRAKETAAAEVRAALQEVSCRIESINLLHEMLHSEGKSDQLDLGAYLTELGENLLAIQIGGPPVRLRGEVASVLVDPDIAVPVGLILNEFITNSLKHAFGEIGGVIGIELIEQEREISLRIWDDGIGRPEPLDGRKGSGINFIRGLGKQIGATIAWSSEGGTSLFIALRT